MSHLVLPHGDSPSAAIENGVEDSPSSGRTAPNHLADDSALFASSTRLPPAPSSTASVPLPGSARSQRTPARSPLQTTAAASLPASHPTGARPPHHLRFPSHAPNPSTLSPPHLPKRIQRLSRLEGSSLAGTSFLEISPPTTPVDAAPSLTFPPNPLDDSPSSQESVVRTESVGSATAGLPNMASGSAVSHSDAARGAPRTSSIDSAVSAMSSRTASQQSSQDSSTDVAGLVRAAGSPEAVIQYLLKEKQSQSQQNAQLWRLVDKQRAMILGLNKDLERVLKDKERYRKKLKEVIAAHDDQMKLDSFSTTAASLPSVEIKPSKEVVVDVPPSPSNLDSDSVKNSPIDASLAPYPITPPADHVPNNPASKMSDMLNPTRTMPKSSEHAVDNFDHEEEERAADQAKKAADAVRDIPIHIGLPPSRSFPSEPPRMPPPAPPVNHQPPIVSIMEATPLLDQGISQFPPPSAPPPRKPPPAPLQLRKDSNTVQPLPLDEDNDSESDYDSLLEVDELPAIERRGRRRTREEDDEEREVLAQQEAETRSLSKKSKKGSQNGTPIVPDPQPAEPEMPISPRTKTVPKPILVRDYPQASLADVLNGNEQTLRPVMMSPGLPASPRPMGMRSLVSSPTFSPGNLSSSSAPLSPRAPRHPIPLPPSTPRAQVASADTLKLTSPKPLNIVKHGMESRDRNREADSPIERNGVFQGFATEEYPDLLLPPNALPSVAVKVASSRMKPSRASLLSLTQLEEDPVFTLAIISRSEGGELWRVEKDSASLAKLDQRMKQCHSFTAKTPDRSLFSGHAPAKLDARRTVLDHYLDELLNTPLDLSTATDLCKYLSTNALPPNTDETSLDESSNDVLAVKEGPGGRPFKNGYLTKKGKNFGGWKARYFVLDGPNLRYYETPGGAHLGTIKLQNAQIGKQSHHGTDGSPAGASNGDELDNQYRHAFLVMEPKKKDSSSHVKHVLCAESDQERDQWVDALLRWIDYRDAKEDELSLKSDGHGHGGSSHVTSTNTRKKSHGQSKPHGQRRNSEEALIGMNYKATKQGNVPDGAPPLRRGTASPDYPEKPSAQPYTISAPRDPQIISDSASWGSKASLPLPGPSLEEKKQRKRSFFGFGPKTRSSSDDQEPIYNSSGGSTPQPQVEPRGPVRQVFGASLAEAVRYCGPSGINVPLPAVVYRCIQYLDLKNAILEEGIFRLSGSNVVIKQLRERFNLEGDIDLMTDDTYYDIHAVASLLKLYLRELPTTILTRDLHMQFVAVTEMPNHREKIMALAELVQRLPLANVTLLKYLIAFLIKIINHADMNKMTVRNVGIVFSPTLNIPAPIFALLLQNFAGVFGIEAEEYELSPMIPRSESPLEAQPRRPSTAGMAESPHRQRLMEQMQQRTTPTPPPGTGLSNSRQNATPPPRQMYDAQYLQQQGSRQTSLRPAYESGFSVPSGLEPASMQQAAFKQPTYDRPHYGYAHSQEQDSDASFTSKSKRRESSMFMGNVLTQQASNSRLREETRM